MIPKSSSPAERSHWSRYRTLYIVMALCAAPVVASYFAYYVVPPSGRTNYGTLIEPQRPLPELRVETLDGRPFDLKSLAGRWILLMVDRGDCDAACSEKLLSMRQQRLMTGKDRDRVERVWLIPDTEPLSTMVMREYEGTLFLRAPAAALAAWLPVDAAANTKIEDHVFVIDPFGNLMMRWPRAADQSAVKRDLAKLLRASSQWLRVDDKAR
jgi:hypothetical protein